MRLKDLLRGIDVLETNASMETDISDICYDSRRAEQNALFVAIEGFETDGHRYIADALRKGCAAVVCQKKPEVPCAYILTRDTRLALALCSANFFDQPSKRLQMIGVTGTNGKTTVTTLIKSILETATGKKAGLIGTNQNMIGGEVIKTEHTTPESRDLQELLFQMAQAGCSYAVMEVSSHSLVLARVASITYEVGVFTNLTQDHLDFHQTMEQYLLAKARLFQASKTAVVNLDDPAGETMLAAAAGQVITYAVKSKQAMLKADNIRLEPGSVSFDMLFSGASVPVKLAIPAMFSVYNALAAAGCCFALGLDLDIVADALRRCEGVKGRVETVPTPGAQFTVIIDYAHTPDALKNILQSARGYARGRVVVLFGCGGDRDRTKRPQMGKIASDLADFVVVTTDNPRTEQPEAIIHDILSGMTESRTPHKVIADRREAIRWAMENAEKDDLLILAGKGHETYHIVGKVKNHMDEREIVAEVLERMNRG
jgi:UDP-N-acetylmuramoyl-L-alanyl-D-glutamate--2,6-diaminopimelate ligase